MVSRPEANNFLLDGVQNVNRMDGGFALKIPIDAIAEFRILTNMAPTLARQQVSSLAPAETRYMVRRMSSFATMRLTPETTSHLRWNPSSIINLA
jgi:hypothetical protein